MIKICILTLSPGKKVEWEVIDEKKILDVSYDIIGCWVQMISYPEEGIAVLLRDNQEVSVDPETYILSRTNHGHIANMIVAGYNDKTEQFYDIEEKRILEFIEDYVSE